MKLYLCLSSLILSLPLTAQENKISLDFSNVINTKDALKGINISTFFHFTEHLSGGVEVNRFFGKKILRKDVEVENKIEEIELSAWDFDCNFHYSFKVSKHLKAYPIWGFSHTTEIEKRTTENHENSTHFWSYNTGLGFMYHFGKISPHIEYLFTWGKTNQEFLLVGFSYEINLSHH